MSRHVEHCRVVFGCFSWSRVCSFYVFVFLCAPCSIDILSCSFLITTDWRAERAPLPEAPRRDGGFERREDRPPREGGFGRREGGFERPPREGGFERREGGFERREGGFERRERQPLPPSRAGKRVTAATNSGV